MSLAEYRQFIALRAPTPPRYGFDPHPINNDAKAHQVAAINFALNRGKSASFMDTGLGKSLIELEYARQAGKNLAEAEASVGDLFGIAAE